jgi:hypothetical protein
MECTLKCVENDVQMLGCEIFYFFKWMMGDDELTFFKKENSWMTMVNVEKDDGECWWGMLRDNNGC